MVRVLGWGLVLAVAWPLALFAQAASPELLEIQVDLGRVEALLERARFREAGEKALLLRSQALALPPSGEARRLVIRTELAAGTAALALGQEGFARECLRRALSLDPRLELEASAAPKLRRTFEAVKASR
jgi:tetratricopeptide (TPR) repeat protein